MIRTVVFDMGNVLVRFSHERMCEQIGRLCGRTGGEVATLLLKSGLQWDFERGSVSEGEFHRRFEETAGRPVPLDDLRHAASDIFVPDGEVREVVLGLKAAGYRL
ncbi:MAG TPA: HAD family phosphatase, partial [Planctomycetaceae bacterium]